ncbi:MAG: hypothetical protein ABI780_04495, partial [Ardenticatenales bacterium]
MNRRPQTSCEAPTRARTVFVAAASTAQSVAARGRAIVRRVTPRRRAALVILMAAAALGRNGGPTSPVSAHNLQTRMVYAFLDPATQTLLDNRISGGWVPGTPILQVNDEVGLIVKVVPRDGTTTGVGGHIDVYVPNGVQVSDTAYLLPDGVGGYDRVPMKGQSPIAIGDGPIGAKVTSQLIGLPAVGPNVLGVTENPVVS